MDKYCLNVDVGNRQLVRTSPDLGEIRLSLQVKGEGPMSCVARTVQPVEIMPNTLSRVNVELVDRSGHLVGHGWNGMVAGTSDQLGEKNLAVGCWFVSSNEGHGEIGVLYYWAMKMVG